jgi:UPF0755 protein
MRGLFVTSLLALLFAGGVFALSGRPVDPKDAGSTLFVVAKGDGAKAVATRLKESGLVRSRTYFLMTVWSRGSKTGFKAGVFELSKSMSTREIERALTAGKPVSNERNVTLLEGWTLEDIADYLEAEGVASKTEFHAEAGESAKADQAGLPDWGASYPALAGRPSGASLEGYLFPDTYRIYVDAGAKALVRRMLANFEAKLTPDLRAEIAAKGRTVHEIVTMASIIEREVRGEEDRAMVSDIFWKRVEAGRGLEADSTVNYVTGHSKPAVSYQETRIDHPWNTYRYRGLPPGPIGNPGLAAILAAIRPKPNPYWYFLTDARGNVHYGATLEEHNANKEKYLR